MFIMKNKTLFLTLLIATSLVFASCAGSKYGCPATASVKAAPVEKNKV
jgi:hypothetical protein